MKTKILIILIVVVLIIAGGTGYYFYTTSGAGKYSSPEKTLSLFIKAMEEGNVDTYLECVTEESQEFLKPQYVQERLASERFYYKEAGFKVTEKTSDRAVMISSMPTPIGIFVFKKEKGGWKIDFKETAIEVQKLQKELSEEEKKEEAKKKSRDIQRVTDLMATLRRGALEFYWDQHGRYPVLTDTSEDGEFLKVLIDEGYLAEMLLDPLHPKYFYEYEGTPDSYTLKCYCEIEGGYCDMADGIKDHVLIYSSP